MSRAVFLFLILFLTSCGDKKEEWLNDYARIKCAYLTKTAQRDSAVAASAKTLETEKQQADTALGTAGKSYGDKISSLRQKIKTAQNDYMAQYRAARDEHESRYGHVSTTAYDQKIDKLAQHRDALVSGYNKEIEDVKREQDADAEYLRCKNKLAAIDTSIVQTKRAVKNKFQYTIDSLQTLLNDQNAGFKTLSDGMNAEELKRFTARRDSLKANPCRK